MRDSRLTRRSFLRGAGRLAAGGAAAGWIAPVIAEPLSPTTTQPAERSFAASQPANTTTRRSDGKSDVVQIRSDNVVRKGRMRPDVLHGMLSDSLRQLTSASDIAEAWHTILQERDVIGIKFNRTGARELATTPILARVLVESLTEAGWDPKQIVLIEAPDALRENLGTTAPSPYWSAPIVDFGSGKDQFAEVLEQITAIINVPFLKTHNIAGMTGCLKNLSHAMVRRPARYHANRCSPYIADIVAAEPIRSKLRLHLINALFGVFDGGPEATQNTIWPAQTMIVSTDPVAADTVGTEILNAERANRGLAALDSDDDPIPALYDAHRKGLGTTSWDEIRQSKLRA
ncbi:MAG: DUF362 domain-containing protein [Phycisphaerae bacterium]|nr:DUF362 domain-containing protein [Phycisphaerae bacterium]